MSVRLMASGGLALLVCGVVYLLWGWRLYRVLLVATVVVVSGVAAGLVARECDVPPLLAAMPVGILCGLCAVWIERFGAFVLGGLSLAAPLADARACFASTHVYLFALIAGFLIAGSLAVVFLRPVMILATSVVGACCIERGVLFLASAARPGIGGYLIRVYPAGFVFIFFGLVVVGILYQTRGRPEEAPEPAEEAPAPQDEGSTPGPADRGATWNKEW